MIRRIAVGVAIMSVCQMAIADQYVNGYTRRDGTYVQGSVRSSPNGTATDNYSFRGNANPYRGTTGTNRYIHDSTSPYYQGPDAYGQTGHSGGGYDPN